MKLPPIQAQSTVESKRNNYGRKRLGDLITAVAPKMRKVLNVNEKYEELYDTPKKMKDFDIYLSNLQTKINNTASKKEKISLLTLSPDSWSHNKAANFFGASIDQVRYAQKLKKRNSSNS